ncbi:hypothetical protein Sango_0391600 [Sesamum angolense]|uniref:BED-type domain-containing protein n=1 Tax=Sesamum angolense TaxID=2727404 RepID=A0AAE1XAP5_9LAMI|nr:hypothetical protein Sango_0391600 [Sesamum angolense]
MVRKLLDEGIKEKAATLRRKEALINAVKEDRLYGDIPNINVDSSDEDNDGIDEYGMSSLERKQMKQAMAESRYTGYVEDELQRNPRRDSGPYMQSMIDTIVEGDLELKGHLDNESSFKAAGEMLMQKRKHLFWSPCAAHCIDLMLDDIGKMRSIKATIDEAKRITSFIYNSDKIVNLMKIYTKDRELLRPEITRFATEYIALERLFRSDGIKTMCTCDEWRTFNNTARRRNEASQVSEIVLTERFWKKARECCAVMEPSVRVLKAVDQDKKPTLCIIYEAMDRTKMAIKAIVRKECDDYYSPIDLNHIFHDNDILEEWTREAEERMLPENDLDWLDEEGRMDNVPNDEDDDASLPLSRLSVPRSLKEKETAEMMNDDDDDDDDDDDGDDDGDNDGDGNMQKETQQNYSSQCDDSQSQRYGRRQPDIQYSMQNLKIDEHRPHQMHGHQGSSTDTNSGRSKTRIRNRGSATDSIEYEHLMPSQPLPQVPYNIPYQGVFPQVPYGLPSQPVMYFPYGIPSHMAGVINVGSYTTPYTQNYSPPSHDYYRRIDGDGDEHIYFVSPDNIPIRRDRCGTAPADIIADTATLNHDHSSKYRPIFDIIGRYVSDSEGPDPRKSSDSLHIRNNMLMAPKLDNGWEHGTPVGGDRKKCKCNYCGKVVHGGITRLKQHIAHVSGNVEECSRVPSEIERCSDEDNDVIDEYGMSSLERKQMKQAMAESRYTGYVEDELQRNPRRDSGPYMQSMIDTIVEVGPGVKGPSGGQMRSQKVIKRLEPDLIVQANAINEEWTREAEERMLPENDLDWLDEEGRMDNVPNDEDDDASLPLSRLSVPRSLKRKTTPNAWSSRFINSTNSGRSKTRIRNRGSATDSIGESNQRSSIETFHSSATSTYSQGFGYYNQNMEHLMPSQPLPQVPYNIPYQGVFPQVPYGLPSQPVMYFPYGIPSHPAGVINVGSYTTPYTQNYSPPSHDYYRRIDGDGDEHIYFVSPDNIPIRRDRCGTAPADIIADTATLNHDHSSKYRPIFDIIGRYVSDSEGPDPRKSSDSLHIRNNMLMAPKLDNGWEHGTPVGGDRKKCKCNYCGKVVHGGITRLKQHIAHVSGNVEECSRVPSEIRKMVRKLLDEEIKEKAATLRRKEALINAVKEDRLYGDIPNINVDSSDEDNDVIDEYGMSSLERKQMKQAMAESRYTGYVEDELQRNPRRDSGPYMQSMIDTIVEVDLELKGHLGIKFVRSDEESKK